MIDRVSGAVRPDGKPAGYQLWRDLLFLHWEVPASLLQSLIPKPLVVDEFEGKAFIGLVPFVMKNVRPRWWTLGAGFNFSRTNMKSYRSSIKGCLACTSFHWTRTQSLLCWQPNSAGACPTTWLASRFDGTQIALLIRMCESALKHLFKWNTRSASISVHRNSIH